ncbi:MAG: hypothetical protein F6K58_07430 [Symploca sp. SIO2E9]|nr:hypothetical protein [Symploca sp. SIO2E9]
MSVKETEAIFTIVFRNIALSNWANLLPEAQLQMLEEVAGLINCEALLFGKKQQLALRLYGLQSYVTEVQRERIIQILALLKKPVVAELNCA